MNTETADRVGLWSAVGFGLYVVMAYGSLVVVAVLADLVLAPFGLVAQAGEVGLSVRNGIWHVAWGLLVAGVALPIGRRLVPSATFGLQGWVVLGTGIGLAGLTEYEINEFIRAWAGYFDPEYAGIGGFAPPALLAVALAGWAALSLPRQPRRIPAVLTVLAAIGLALAMSSNLQAAADGVRPGHMEIAAVFVLDAVYAIATVLVVLRSRTVARRA